MAAFGVLLDIDGRHIEHLANSSEPNEVTPRFVLGEKLFDTVSTVLTSDPVQISGSYLSMTGAVIVSAARA